MDDTADGIARWRKVADEIRAMIGAAGAGAPDRLPVETELAARFGVNRHTVRRAIAALAAEGLLRPERGRGTFVERRPDRIVYPVGARTRFTENISQNARQAAGRLIGSGRESADRHIANQLQLAPGAALVRLESLNVADGVPLSVGTSWFPADRFPRIVAAYAETGSITKALAAHGVADYARRSTRITAERVAHDDAEHLGCASDAIVIVSESANYDADGVPIQFSRSRFLADRVELVFDS
ncbi:phosphonate metabolism transcriptional regulator PhnF [Aurantimonas aggregata]|uniref:Phosphonate metabolism transcriptional regulator PhnF n=1 Tax=Aurantimonas aggregata TaxID=2047720 RepID=A0A6L9MLJ2_9HYPH|nr:phosphonate metabolism transcriptional regulator PhnF [Aurantimonas aggregata]NDV88542.1 phosphonate metabolism transcriptional regulator PhnF [Aurantimonas aggregata]